MKSFFASVTRLSLRMRYVTLLLCVIIAVLGVTAVSQLQLELIPDIAFPQTIILAQTSGMSSDEVLNVLTVPMEHALSGIDKIVNTETTTTGAFGAVLIARNDFGINQAQLQQQIREAIDGVWLPLRRIQAPAGGDPQAFAASLLGDMPADVMLYMQAEDPNFLFQLSPEVWQALPADTVETLMAYLAGQSKRDSNTESALRRVVDLDLIPQLDALDVVANVNVSGGQALPGEEDASLAVEAPASAEAQSLLTQLSPDAQTAILAKLNVPRLDAADFSAVSVEMPEAVPALPDSWQMDRFSDARDLVEMGEPLAKVLNDFATSGEIVGPLGQTDDLTPEILTQMLAVAPSMLDHFEPEQLAALSPEVFAALPADAIAGLDGFARDELAATGIAAQITGSDTARQPVDLPDAWRIARPQLVTFSFDDLPLATFSVFGTGSGEAAVAEDTTSTTGETAPTPTPDPSSTRVYVENTVPTGPALPALYGVIGQQMNVELDTADDLISIHLPADFADLAGTDSLSAADFFNFMTLLRDPSALGDQAGFDTSSFDVQSILPALQECGINPLSLLGNTGALFEGMIRCISPDAVEFLVQQDPTFLPNLQPEVFDFFSDDTLKAVAPPLPDAWDTLAEQPQFAEQPLQRASDLLALGDGSAVLNAINAGVPQQFEGYEVRLFSSLTPTLMRYLRLHEADLYSKLDPAVLRKLSPETLAAIPQDALSALPDDLVNDLNAIANGDQPSALDALSSLYVTNVPPADPSAPPINADWALVGNFYGIELDSADDFFRFPEGFRYTDAASMMNSIFESAQGAAFAPRLFGGLSVEVVQYMLNRDPTVLDNLRAEALQQMPADVLAVLPQALQDRAAAGGRPFVPTETITRSNGEASLQLRIYKAAGTNTVEAFHQVKALMDQINAENDNIEINVVFEQASFIEESIDGVAREGGLGGIFAIVMILIFLSSGLWARNQRRIVGAVLIVLALVLLGLAAAANLDAAGGDFALAFQQINIVIQVPLTLILVAGLVFILWPGRLPYPAWRSTLVTAVSIPLSVLIAFALMRWLPGTVHHLLQPSAGAPLVEFILRLFPEKITLNIMTLSGLTVAIGRIVDDSIVVLENIFRHLQEGGSKREAIIIGTRDVSVAIFAATVITVVVFIPLGLTGGIIGEFFLPFGLAVTYSLMASFLVAITVVPVLVFLFVRQEDLSEDEGHGLPERIYLPVLGWALANRRNQFIVLGVAFATMIFGFVLFATRPAAFLPDFGEPQISVAVSMPAGTKIMDTNARVEQLETYLQDNIPAEDLDAVETIVGSGGLSLETLLGTSGISENQAEVTIAIASQSDLDRYAQQIRGEAEQIFGPENVTVSAASVVAQGFGSFSLVLSGPQETLAAIDPEVTDVLNKLDGLTNVSSTLSLVGGATSDDGPVTYLRVDGETAVSYSGELESEDSLNVIRQAKEAVLALPDLPDTVKVSEGFETEVQTQGFNSLFVAMGIAIGIVILILIVTFGSLVHWLDIILSIVVAPVGAAVALTLTNRVLGISALIGLLMLIGIVVTNAVVLIDRVMANIRERDESTHDALMEAGGRRLRPILMTAFATIFALLPLAVGLSEGAIIASELGTVVIGGLFSSTLLTLLVVPVAYSLLQPLHLRVSKMAGRSNAGQ